MMLRYNLSRSPASALRLLALLRSRPLPRLPLPLLGLLLAGLLAAPALARAQAPKVLVSIQPLHALAASVLGERGEATLLLRGAASPHAYALRPSDARALASADLVLWVGPELEAFLTKPLAAGRADRTVLQADRLPGVRLLPAREGGI